MAQRITPRATKTTSSSHRLPQKSPDFKPLWRWYYIYPVEPREEPNLSYRVLRSVYPVFRMLFPNQVIPADDLAHAMVDIVVWGTDTDKPESRILENRDIRAFVKSYHSSVR